VITFFEEGEPMIDGEPGDLKFVLRTIPSKRWERRGSDLLINETITLLDALTGEAHCSA
jgi:DnaJ family protein B protein 11